VLAASNGDEGDDPPCSSPVRDKNLHRVPTLDQRFDEDTVRLQEFVGEAAGDGVDLPVEHGMRAFRMPSGETLSAARRSPFAESVVYGTAT